MADTKITSLLTPQVTTNPATDVLPIVNIADTSMATSGSTRKITVNQLLGAGGTATLASATITGDLTVKTNVLKVDTTNNRVGIGTASPGSALDVYGETRVRSGNQLRVYRADNAIYSSIEDAGSGVGLSLNNANGDGFLLKVTSNNVYQVSSSYVQTWYDGAGGTRMTLNATGLGVGVASANGIKLSSFVTTDGAPATSGTTQTTGSLRIGAASTTGAMDMGTAGSYSWIQVLDRGNLATNYDLVLQKNGGNVGIGVTPTYKLDTQVAGGADRSILRAAVTGVSGGFNVNWNHATLKTRVIIENIPTSSAGLPAGTLWNDAGTIKIA